MVTYAILLEPFVGAILASETFLFYWIGTTMIGKLGLSTTLYIGIVLHAISWATQFVGHGVYEKRRPALVDNLFQVFIAPLFVILELLFEVGYRPAFHKEANRNITKYCRENFSSTPKAK